MAYAEKRKDGYRLRASCGYDASGKQITRSKSWRPEPGWSALGHLSMDKITTRHMQRFVNNLGEDGVNKTTGGGLKPKTIKTICLTFPRCFNTLSAWVC